MKNIGLFALLTLTVIPGLVYAQFQMELNAEAGGGYDSNIYRSPSSSYMDNSLKTPVLVSPKVESGFYTPVALNGRFEYLLKKRDHVYIDGDFNAVQFVSKKYNNANQQESTVRVGNRYFLNPDSRFEYFDAALEISDQKRLYVDRDSGGNMEATNGIDISERYSYTSKGAFLKYKQEEGPFDYVLGAKLIDRDYVDAVFISEMDHRYTEIAAGLSYKISNKRSVYGDYSRQSYRYSERPSRDADGTLSSAYPALEYRVQTAGLGVKQKLNKKIKIAAEYDYTIRDDLYVGYHDYRKQRGRLKLRYAYNKQTVFKASALYWVRDYPNAYAFDEPGQKAKEYDGTQVSLSLSREIYKLADLNLDVKYVDENSTDLRYAYERYQIVGTIEAKW